MKRSAKKRTVIEREVEAMAGMNRRQIRIVNGVANTLVNRHHMCLDCAIAAAVAFTIGLDRPTHHPTTSRFCSQACADAMHEFMTDTLDCKGEIVDWSPPSIAS
jgi:hypothetical protein